MKTSEPRAARIRRHARIRNKVAGDNARPRLCVFRSLNHIYAQLVDDAKGKTLIAASTIDPELKNDMGGKTKKAQAELVGALVAKKAKEKGMEQVVFDRGGYKYIGRVQALADAARKNGLKF